jgi:hypothetical protein
MLTTKDRTMRVSFSFVSPVAGILAGAVLVLSCGDDAPGNADAGACQCPASEAPLAGRILIMDQTQTLGAGMRGGQSTSCPEGGLRLSGSCTLAAANPVYNVTLEQSGFFRSDDLTGWSCDFKNNEAIPVTIKASVVCLMPPTP